MSRLSAAPLPDPGPKYLSTAIDFTDARASVDTLMRVAGSFRLNAESARMVLADVVNAVAAWREVAASHGLSGREIELMRPAFEHPEAKRARSLTQSR
jgi:serine/threonine-protein kinase HipA